MEGLPTKTEAGSAPTKLESTPPITQIGQKEAEVFEVPWVDSKGRPLPE